MKKNSLPILIFCFVAIVLPSFAFGQSAKEAILALKKLDTRIETGISYKDYASVVADAKFPVKLFLESAEAKNEPQLAKSLSEILNLYDAAFSVWKWKYSERKVQHYIYANEDAEIFKEIIRVFSDAPVHYAEYTKQSYMDIDEVLSFIWQKASEELKVASDLLSKSDAKAETTKIGIETLKKENEELKQKIETSKNEMEVMKQENEKLKEENEKLKNAMETLQTKLSSPKKKK